MVVSLISDVQFLVLLAVQFDILGLSRTMADMLGSNIVVVVMYCIIEALHQIRRSEVQYVG